MEKYTLHLAQAYGAGTYSSCAYSEGQRETGSCSTTSSAGPVTSPGGALADTGVAIIVIITLACLIVFVALIVRIWRRKPVTLATQPVDIDREIDSER